MIGTNRCPYCWKAPHVEGKEVHDKPREVRWIIACCGLSCIAEDLGRAIQGWNGETAKAVAGWIA